VPPPSRKLTTHQKAVLIHVLLTFPAQQVTVCYSPSASDARAYALDFLTIFRAIGWNVSDAESADCPDGLATGLALIVDREGSLPTSAQAFRDALRIYGIETEIRRDPARSVAPGSFVLSVGSQRSSNP
jgi:hypothetical protein